jgi:hypothetical protein
VKLSPHRRDDQGGRRHGIIVFPEPEDDPTSVPESGVRVSVP